MQKIQACLLRRQKLIDTLGEDAIAIIAAAPVATRNADNSYPYRQESNFYYLTGFNEEESILVIAKGSCYGDVILFCQQKDPIEEQWTGSRTGTLQAAEDYQIDCVLPISEFSAKAPLLFEQKKVLYVIEDKADHPCHIAALLRRIDQQQPITDNLERKQLGPILAHMRLIKDDYEIDCMQRAADISVDAHLAAWARLKTANNEADIAATIGFTMESGHCECAYPSIVAAGNNGLTLHYIKNKDPLNKGELLLIDAGAEYKNYAADITRTIPISGTFSCEQKIIYEIVLAAQQAVINAAKAGTAFHELQTIAVEKLTEGLIDIGILSGQLTQLIEQKAYQTYYMHGVSHWLGLDVHDCGALSRQETIEKKLQPGMCLTVEPGLYIPRHDNIDKKWHGIAVRIEDDILITDKEPIVLTARLPKTVSAIESAINHDQ